MKDRVLLSLCVLTCVLFVTCNKAMTIDSASQAGAQQAKAQQETVETSKTKDASQPRLGVITSNLEASKAWRRFLEGGRYRVAHPDDFNFSDQNRKDRYRPYGAGDFNGDHEYDDFAVIVVDTTRNDALRFGLVIFNVRKVGNGYDGPFWLYRESDLSKVSLTTSSHGPLLVAKYGEDDAIKLCVVRWEQEQKEYECDEDQQVR